MDRELCYKATKLEKMLIGVIVELPDFIFNLGRVVIISDKTKKKEALGLSHSQIKMGPVHGRSPEINV